MTLYDRIADYSGFKSWDDMLELAKDSSIEIKIPPYLFYGNKQIANEWAFNTLFETIKQSNFKLTFDDDKVYLTRDKESDIIEPTIDNKEETS